MLNLFLVIFLMVSPIFLGDAIGQPPPPAPEPIPIDGGLGFLLFAGMAYGARKLYQTKEDSN